MNDISDAELLERFVPDKSETAFSALVEGYLDLVHSVAEGNYQSPRRPGYFAGGFVILPRKAASLGAETVLPGWLYHTTGLTAANFIRAKVRRARREREAVMESDQKNESVSDTVWSELSVNLESALAQLGPADRDALVLRYFQNRSMTEVGAALHWKENAAHNGWDVLWRNCEKSFRKVSSKFSGCFRGSSFCCRRLKACPG